MPLGHRTGTEITMKNYHKQRLLLVGLAVFVAVNAVAFWHARRMTHFIGSGQRTSKPETLSLGQRALVIIQGVELPKPQNTSAPTMKHATVQVETRDGVKLELWDVPAAASSEIVLMFHGYGGCKSTMLHEAAVFHELGKHVALVDFRGSGGSAGEVTTLGWHEALDVAAAVQWAQKQYPEKRLVLFGQSMGAVAVLRAVKTESVEPAAMILECPFDSLLHTINHRFTAMGLPAFPFAPLLVFWGGVQVGINGFEHDARDYAAAVRCPTLVLWGADDARVARAEVEAVVQSLNGHGKLEVLSAVGHQSYCKAQPAAYRRVVRAWFERKS